MKTYLPLIRYLTIMTILGVACYTQGHKRGRAALRDDYEARDKAQRELIAAQQEHIDLLKSALDGCDNSVQYAQENSAHRPINYERQIFELDTCATH